MINMENQEVLVLKGIKKSFRKKEVLKDVNMNIHKGDICGFIGKNGAGKSTTIRIISGLINASGGQISLFGGSEAEELTQARCSIGGDVDAPTFYKGMSAKQNLEAFSRLLGKKAGDGMSIEQALNMVGLENVGRKKVGKFSTGMKQRLAIARSLLNNPKFLILDEPSNGLDPNGMVEMRKLITKLVKEYDMTVLISSHILGELEKIATKFCFISEGATIEEISEKDLHNKFEHYTVVKAPENTEAVEEELKKIQFQLYKKTDDELLYLCENDSQYEQIRELVKKISERNEVFMRSQTLEEYYFELVGE